MVARSSENFILQFDLILKSEVKKMNVTGETQMKARPYQLELLDYVTENNGIIYLPTGAGKTFIAILAIKRFAKEMDRTIDDGGKRGIFMCRTVELSIQQSSELRKHTNLRIGLYIGERGVDAWSSEKWKKEIDENQVLVGTAQIFLSIVSQNIIKITDLSIVVIDECHHGTKKDAMHEFMRLFPPVTETVHIPRVIGLTGVLLKGNKHNSIMESLRNLEITYRSKIITISSKEEFMNVLIHSTSPKEEWLLYKPTLMSFNIEESIKTQINDCLSIISDFDIGNHPIKFSRGLVNKREPSQKRNIIKMINEFYYHLDEYGLYCSLLVLQSAIVELQIKQHQAETIALRHMYRVVITHLESIQHMIFRKFKEFLNEDNLTNADCHRLKVILEFSSSKIKCLLDCIEKTFAGKQRNEISCLIFIERRLTAKVISQILEKFIATQSGFKEILFPTFMVGRSSMFASPVENIIERKWSKKTMSDFHKGINNIIVCSNVLEEGIDVHACNYVIAFDQLATFNAYIQTKGRARSKDSKFFLICSETKYKDYLKQTQKYHEIQESVKNFLSQRVLEPSIPDQEEIDAEFANRIPPFRNENGACLLASSALTILNRYCQNLPWDIYGCLLPMFKKIRPQSTEEIHGGEGGGGVVVSVQLPMQSQVKEVILSDPMENVQMAKISAAMKACRRLYEEGELNEKLLPTSRQDCIELVSDVLFKHWEKYKEDNPLKKDGKKKQRIYEKKCPEELYEAMPVVGEVCYAHKIKIEPQFEPNEYNSHIIDALKTSSKYALLLRRRLPYLAPMPIFMQQGQLIVYIEEGHEMVINNEEQLEQLRKYHLMIMRDLLQQCWRSYYVLDSRNKQNSFLVVPLREGDEIDWEIVKNFARLKPILKPSASERENRVYKPEDWLNKIIAKWYSNSSSERFIVTKVCTDRSALDKFDFDGDGDGGGEEQITFAEFFEKRYENEIERVCHRKQFLLEVKQLTSRRNFFNNAKSKDRVIQKSMQKIMLLPELCHNFQYPGNLWLQALFLPSILHRLHYLLHAEQLRKRINSFLGINNGEEGGYKPKPLIIDISLRRAVDFDGNACIPYEKKPSLLPKIPENTKESSDVVCSNSHDDDGGDSTPWRAYEEPINFSRHSKNLYPIEVQYYAEFDKKWSSEQNIRDVAANSSNDHLKKIKSKMNNNNDEENISRQHLSSIDQSLDEKRRIHILEKSFSKKKGSKSSNIPTAEQYEFLAALTTSSANDVFDMERFELLGDSFLKFSMSLYLANKFPKWHEGYLTDVKSKLISNRNLLYCMLETDIPTRICSNIFTFHDWLPPLVSLPVNFLNIIERNADGGYSITANDLSNIELDESEVQCGRLKNRNLLQFVTYCQSDVCDDDGEEGNDNLNFCTYREERADKIVADTLEALLGVCVKNYGINMSFRLLEFFGLLRQEIGDKPLTQLLDLKLGGSLLRTGISAKEIDNFLVNHKDLEGNLGYTFKDRAFLLQALTHPSFPTNRLTGCYQELEFIGDAILDLLITCYIFERNRTMTPGMLTDLRSALVNNITLGCICVRYRFHLYLLAENVTLSEMIRKFVEFQETHNQNRDQIHILMEEGESGRNISQNIEVPKVLGDIVEALIAAVYLDSRCLKTTWNVIYGLFERELIEFSQKVPIDPVRQLYEHPSANPLFSNAITDNEITNVKCKFFCIDKWHATDGFGKNKWEAKKAAAKHALRILAKALN